MRLYIIRHGETDWNKAKRLQGQSDTELNDYGREIARATSEGLRDIPFKYIYSSPLSRAYETAKILRRDRDIPIITDERLREVGFGIDEGKPYEERSPGLHLFFDAPEEYVPTKEAESYHDLLARTQNFIEEIIVPMSQKEPDITVMISGHGAMNMALITYLQHKPLSKFWDCVFQSNCAVNIFEIDGYDFTTLEEGKLYYDGPTAPSLK